ncbi:MAG: transposase [Phycisphaeraceae bacterium]
MSDTQSRSRRHRYEGLEDVRFLTFSCYRNLKLLAESTERDLFAEHLLYRCESENRDLLAWVVMPNHVHILLGSSGSSTVGSFLHRLKSRYGRLVVQRWKRNDDPRLSMIRSPEGNSVFWQRGGGYDRNIHSEEEFAEKSMYIENNPVRAGLVRKPEGWKWSHAGWSTGHASR